MKLAKHIKYWDDERKIGNSLIATLQYGFCFDEENSGCHIKGFDTINDAKYQTSKRRIFNCNCIDCADAKED